MAVSFGEMLLARRRQMGLSIQQVANTIKMRPQIIEFFETCDYASMPPRGYAQGMISSYARFLGLNPREVVDAYFDGLYRYEHDTNANGGSFLGPTMDPSPRSSNATGRFMMVEGGRVPSQGSRYGQRPPQAGYVTGARSAGAPGSGASGRSLPPRSGYPAQQVAPQRGGRPASRMSGAASANGRPRYASPRNGSAQRAGSRQQGPRPASGRAGGAANGARGASGMAPAQRRPGSRPMGAAAPGYRGQSRGRSGAGRSSRPAPSGFDLSALMGDQRVFLACLGAIAVLLVLVIVLAVRGCSGGAASDRPASSQATASTAAASGSASAAAPTASSDLTASDGSASATVPTTTSDGSQTGQQAAAQATPTEYKVKVAYTGDKTAWIEIKVNGQYDSEVNSVAKGFSKEYTVTESIEITTNSPSDVTVTKDGERVRYDRKSSGVGSVTITVPKQETTSTDGGQSADQASTASGDGGTASTDAASQQTSTDSGSSSASSSGQSGETQQTDSTSDSGQ